MLLFLVLVFSFLSVFVFPFSLRTNTLQVKVKSPMFLSPVSLPSLPRDKRCHEVACVQMLFYMPTTPTHTCTRAHVDLFFQFVKLYIICIIIIEHNVLQSASLPLHNTSPKSIYIVLVRGSANFFQKGPSSKYFFLLVFWSLPSVFAIPQKCEGSS